MRYAALQLGVAARENIVTGRCQAPQTAWQLSRQTNIAFYHLSGVSNSLPCTLLAGNFQWGSACTLVLHMLFSRPTLPGALPT